MRVDELRDALQTASATQAAVDDALDAVMARRAQRRRNAIGIGTVVALVVVAVTVGVVTRSTGDGDDEPLITDQVGDVRPAVAGEWERLPDPPLSDLLEPTMVWTGDEVLVVEDEAICPGNSGCTSEQPLLARAAAFDPETRTWRSIADAPVVSFDFAAFSAVVGDDVYLLEFSRSSSSVVEREFKFVRYSISNDTWAELGLPPVEMADLEGTTSLLATDSVVLLDSSGSGDATMVFDPATDAWTALPADPIGPRYSRGLVWVAPYLYLFADPDHVDTEDAPVTHVARFNPRTRRWEHLPPIESLGQRNSGTAAGTKIVFSARGTGRDDYRAVIYDTVTGVERLAPEIPFESRGITDGVIGPDRVWTRYAGYQLAVLDAVTENWVQAPPMGDGSSTETRHAVGTDRAIVAIGGERGSNDPARPEPSLLGGAWILTFERP